MSHAPRHTPAANDATGDAQERISQDKVLAYRRAGYTAVFMDFETGELIPGHTDRTLADALDFLEWDETSHAVYYDDLGQAYREDSNEHSE